MQVEIFHDAYTVSIPERVLEALKRVISIDRHSSCVPVSIPERVLEALKRRSQLSSNPILIFFVSIPERVLEALKHKVIAPVGSPAFMFQSLKGF